MRRLAILVGLLVAGTNASAMPLCIGDHDGDCKVRINELVACLRSALGQEGVLPAVCDPDRSGSVSIAELLHGVRNALLGCEHAASGPAPGRQMEFRLAGGSFVTLPDGSEEAIDGSFLVSSCFSFNTFFAGRLETLRWRSDSVKVEGGCSAIGQVVASTIFGGATPTSFSSDVLVNGEQLSLSGQGPYDRLTQLDLTLAAGPYRFRVIAQLQEIKSPDSWEPLCQDWGFV